MALSFEFFTSVDDNFIHHQILHNLLLYSSLKISKIQRLIFFL